MANQAAWLDGKGEQLRVGETEKATPGAGEVLIQNKALAISEPTCADCHDRALD